LVTLRHWKWVDITSPVVVGPFAARWQALSSCSASIKRNNIQPLTSVKHRDIITTQYWL
jgi:hypothetical protein